MGEGKFLYAIIERPENDDFPYTGLNDASLAVVGYRDLAAVISTIDVDQLSAADAVWLKAALVHYQEVNAALLAQRQISLAETLDRVLNKGVVLVGEITLSIADIDLLYLGVNVILSSIDTIERLRREMTDGRTSH